ncbi:MAG: hypothetical protein V4587_05500, partial [Acidobacteriota bacterium]
MRQFWRKQRRRRADCLSQCAHADIDCPFDGRGGAPATTVVVYGSNFQDGVAVQWNGTTLPTSCVTPSNIGFPTTCTGTTVLTASVPASDLAAAGSATITVSNPNPGGGTSGSVPFTVTAAPTATAWVRDIPGITSPQDIVWDAVHGKLYVSIGSSDPVAPNTLLAINPVTGTAATPVPAGNNPDHISLSSDASYLWVGLDGSNAVQRFLLPGLTKDISFQLPVDVASRPQQAVALQAAPVSTHTVAVVAGHTDWTTPGNGVYIYDDAIKRPTNIPGFGAVPGPEIDWIQWGANDSTIYGNQYSTIDQGGIATLNVTPSGVSLANYNGGQLNPTITQYDKSNGLLYNAEYVGNYNAIAYDPVKLTQVGQFNMPVAPDNKACTADSSLNRYYCVTTYTVGGTDVTSVELWVFNLNTYALVNRIFFGDILSESTSQPDTSITGQIKRLVRWGNAGLALITQTYVDEGNGGIYLIDGAAVNPGVPPDVTSGTTINSYASLRSMSPQETTVGSADVTVTINGAGFSPDSTACANCSFLQFEFLPTTYVSPTQLNVAIPAAELAAAGSFDISVFDQSANLFSSNALTFTVLPASGGTQVTPLDLAGLAMAWDANSGLLYVGTADYDSAYPNSIVAIDPESGKIVKTQPVGQDPILLSDSVNGEYLYVGYEGTSNLDQLALPGLNTTASAVLNNGQNGPYFPGDLKAAPGNPHTVAVTLINPYLPDPDTGGVVIFDNATPRANSLPGWGGFQPIPALFYTLAWGSSDTVLASTPGPEDAGGSTGGPLYELEVSPSGVGYVNQGTATFNPSGVEIHSDSGTGYIYSDDGNVADPMTGAIVGSYNASGLVAPDSSLNRVFILGQTTAQANSNSYTIDS